jgi:hypothetical protein
MDIPDFKNQEHKGEFYELYEQKVATYWGIFNKTLQQFLPGYGMDHLDARTLKFLSDITNSVMYITTETFENLHPEYKTDNIFVSKTELKQSVKEALEEYNSSTTLKDFSLGES